ncbi:glycine-rich cell wall structural protein-like [Triticum aestivum]|uniref:glycine-rich cell wall structural protein-like n=1 Tax=Triticum aestivum TaxID=4565 RepID=UPI001D02BC12|nr:glycine-rich cell wall structural protein-like [Triticum aestivum]
MAFFDLNLPPVDLEDGGGEGEAFGRGHDGTADGGVGAGGPQVGARVVGLPPLGLAGRRRGAFDPSRGSLPSSSSGGRTHGRLGLAGRTQAVGWLGGSGFTGHEVFGAHDGGALGAHDGGAFWAHDGGALGAHDGGAFRAHDGDALGAHDGGAFRAHDGDALGSHDGGAFRAHDGGAFRAHDGDALGVHDGGVFRAHDGGAFRAHDGDALGAHDGGAFRAHDGGRAGANSGSAFGHDVGGHQDMDANDGHGHVFGEDDAAASGDEENGTGDTQDMGDQGNDAADGHDTGIDLNVMANKKRRAFYTDDDKRSFYTAILEMNGRGPLKHGVTRELSARMKVPARVLRRVWNNGRRGGGVNAVINRKPGRVGRKRITLDSVALAAIPPRHRTTIRDVAGAMNMSKTTVHKLLKEHELRKHTNELKPLLTEENKKARIMYCISNLEPASMPENPIFKDSYNVIHIDEKWFYLTRRSQGIYLGINEPNP